MVLLNGEWGRKRYVYVPPAKDFQYFMTPPNLDFPPPLGDAVKSVARKSEVLWSVGADYEFPSSFELYHTPTAPEMRAADGQWAEVEVMRSGRDPGLHSSDVPRQESIVRIGDRMNCVFAIDVARAFISTMHRLWSPSIGITGERVSSGYTRDILGLINVVGAEAGRFPILDMYRKFRTGMPANNRVYVTTPGHGNEAKVYTMQDILERARVDRKALWAAVRERRDSFPNFVKVRDDLRACYGSPCETCGALDKKISYCARCKAVAYCSKECQAQAWPKHKGECTRSAQ